jgi:hypothetical protein
VSHVKVTSVGGWPQASIDFGFRQYVVFGVSPRAVLALGSFAENAVALDDCHLWRSRLSAPARCQLTHTATVQPDLGLSN